ncbi:LPXTG cell wall anchor domain-containing protein [Streptomyces sp. NPDC001941]|uniref:LPXTG cell wall anchor domain-containing protein n=1 Tax=Streptomyces sp. NPDC001941 TaxID=3154659 RepID=UPI003320E1EC
MNKFRTTARGLAALAAAAGLVGAAATGAAHAADGAGAGADLVLERFAAATGAKAGAPIGLSPQVGNKGGTAAAGVILVAHSTYGLRGVQSSSSCEYETDEREAGGLYRTVCVLDGTVAPGALYGTSRPLGMTTEKYAMDEALSWKVVPYSAKALEEARAGRALTKGSGAPVTLVKRAGKPSGNAAIELQTVRIANTADLSVAGARLTGKEGETVALDVTVLNKGPGWIGDGTLVPPGPSDAFFDVVVTLPPGTTATSTGEDCSTEDKGKRVRCSQYLVGSPGVLPDVPVTWPLKLRVDKVVPDAEGAVAIDTHMKPSPDKNPENDVAEIVLNATPGGSGGADAGGTSTTGGSTTGSGGTTGSTGGSGSTGGATGSTGGTTGTTGGSTTGSGSSASGTTGSGSTTGAATGGGLASTGSDDAVPLMAGAGALLAAGGAMVVVARRKRGRA